MKSLLTLSFTLFLLASCGGKKAQTSFSLNAGALLNGSTPLGGAVIVGSNGVDKFSAGLNATEVSNFSLELPEGNWNFYAVAWLDDLAEGPMSGKARCGVSQAQVQGSNISIELSLTNENCASSVFGPVITKDTTSYPGETTFKKVYLNSCNNPVGYPALCDSSTIEAIPGESASLQFVIPGYSSFGNNPPSLSSACMNPQVHDQGLFYSNIRLPIIGNLGPIPILLKGYEKLNCIDSDASYSFSGVIPGLSPVDRSVTANTPTYTTLTFADNYVGVTGSPFIDAQNNNLVKLPIINCGSSCYNTPNKSIDYAFAKDEVREGVWSLFGSNNKKDPDEYVASTSAIYNLFNGGTGSLVNLTADSSLGTQGNNIELTYSSLGVSGGVVSVSCVTVLRTISISAHDDATPTDIANAVNSNCGGFITASVSNANPGTFTPGTYWFSGGADTFSGQGRREEGSVTELKHILFGAVGGILYANNITTGALLCSSSGSYSYQLEDELVVITLGSATASAVHPKFAANSAATFEKKLTISFDGVTEDALYFNCNDAAGNDDHAVGTYISYKTDDRLEYVQTSWDVTTANNEWVERAIEQTENGFTIWRYDLFKITGTVDNWNYWAMIGSDQYNSYRRVAATAGATAGSIHASSFDTGSPSDTSPAFLAVGQDEWSISSGAFLASGANTTVEPVSINANVTNPRVYSSFSMNDMVNNAAFWDFTY